MININYGHNGELLRKCKALNDYSLFVYNVRENLKRTRNLSVAIDLTIAEMPEESLIKPFLITNRAEVKSMFITEYDEARTFAEQRAEGREQGLEEGREQGREQGLEEGRKEGREQGQILGTIMTLVSLVKKGFLSVPQAAEEAHMSVSEFEAQMNVI